MADVLKRTVRAFVQLEQNELTMYGQEYLDSDRTFTESVHQRAVLLTNMTSFSEFDITNVDTPALLFLENDRAVTIALNTTANAVTLADAGFIMMYGTFTGVYVKNENTTYTATVELVVTD